MAAAFKKADTPAVRHRPSMGSVESAGSMCINYEREMTFLFFQCPWTPWPEVGKLFTLTAALDEFPVTLLIGVVRSV